MNTRKPLETLKQKLQQIWDNKAQIAEGFMNALFSDNLIEEMAAHRMSICRECKLFDNGEDNSACIMPGTQPCCNRAKGGCGCSLYLKTRSVSSNCPRGHWEALMSEQEEALL